VNGGDLRSVRHSGQLRLVAEAADLTIEGTTGATQINTSGGSVLLQSAGGAQRIQARGSQVQVVGSQNSGDFTTADSMIDILDSNFSRLNIRDNGSYITTARTNGATTIDLTGGSFSADDGGGTIKATLRASAELGIDGHEGNIDANLSDGARGDLRSVRGAVNAQLAFAELDVDDAESLSLTVTDGRAMARGIRALTTATATRGELDLDLSACSSQSLEVTAGADSLLRVELATPCRVRVKGLENAASSRIDVTGCEYQLGQGRKWATRNVRGVDGNPPVTLTATVAPTAELTVEGR
jgi:hypothetical protein